MIQRSGSAQIQRDRMISAPVFSSAFPVTARRTTTVEAWARPARPAQTAKFAIGARVFHDKFGNGTVTAVDEDRLDIDFDKAGAKKVLDRFVDPT